MSFPTGWNKKHKIKIDHTKVSGSANLSNFPVLFTEANFLSSAFDNSQGKEIYTNHLLNDANLIGYWRFEDNLSDSSGEGHNLTGTAPDYVSGLFGKCADFNGSDDQVYIEDASFDFSGTAPLTFSAWVYVDTMPSSGKRFVPIGMQEGTTEGTWDKGLIINADGSVSFYVFDGAPKYASSSAGVISAGKWFLLTGTYDGTNAKIYVNGVLLGTVAATGTYNFTTPRVVFSKDNVSESAYTYYNGKIDDAAIFNRALTATEIMGLYTGGQDLRFSSDSAGSTQLAHEVVNWDIVNDKAEVYVKIPTLSYTADTEIYVWYDNDTATPQARNDTYGSNNVWSNNYIRIYHLEGNSIDSTGTQNGTSTNITFDTSNGFIGQGAGFNASSASKIFVGDPNASTQYTVSVLSYITKTGTWGSASNSVIFSTYPSHLILAFDANVKLQYYGNSAWRTSANTTTQNTWNWISLRRNGTSGKIRRNTTEDLSDSNATYDLNGYDSVSFGVRDTQGIPYNYNGKMDEIRISSVERTDGWLDTEYNNQNSPATFATPIVSFVPKVIFIS